MPVEAARVRRARYAVDQRQLAQLQLGVASLAALQPRSHVGPGGGPDQHIVERRPATFQDGTLAARVPDLDLRAGLRSARRLGRQRQFRRRLQAKFQGQNLPETPGAATRQHDIAAHLQFQAMQRGLKREPAPVNRCGEWKDRRFEVPAYLAESLQLRAEARLPACGRADGRSGFTADIRHGHLAESAEWRPDLRPGCVAQLGQGASIQSAWQLPETPSSGSDESRQLGRRSGRNRNVEGHPVNLRPRRDAPPGYRIPGDHPWWAGGAARAEGLRLAARISMLKARIHAGNSSSTQGEKPTPISRTSALTKPATVSHLETISVRRAMVTVVSVNTAAIRMA